MNLAAVHHEIDQIGHKIATLVNQTVKIDFAKFKRLQSELSDPVAINYIYDVIKHLEAIKRTTIEIYQKSFNNVKVFISLLHKIAGAFQSIRAIQVQIDYSKMVLDNFYAVINEDVTPILEKLERKGTELNAMRTKILEQTVLQDHQELYNLFNAPITRYGDYFKRLINAPHIEGGGKRRREVASLIEYENNELEQIDFLITYINRYRNSLHFFRRDIFHKVYITQEKRTRLFEKKNVRWVTAKRDNEGEYVKNENDYFSMLREFVEKLDDVSAGLIVAACFNTPLFKAQMREKDGPNYYEATQFTKTYGGSYRYYLFSWIKGLEFYLNGEMRANK